MRKREEEFGKVKKLYISMMSLFELADKLFGATYVAFMRSQKLSVVQISNLFSIQQILQAVFDYPTGTISDKIGRKRTGRYRAKISCMYCKVRQGNLAKTENCAYCLCGQCFVTSHL